MGAFRTAALAGAAVLFLLGYAALAASVLSSVPARAFVARRGGLVAKAQIARRGVSVQKK